MIAIQKIGKSFMGALGYNLKKINHADLNRRAQLLDSNFSSLDRQVIKGEVDLVRQLRPNLKRYVYHTSLNFPHEELQSLTNENLLAIAHDYLAASGYTNNQYLVFRHFDAGHPHLHFLVNRICFDGTVVSDSNNYKRSETILRKLEKLYNLVAVQPSNKVSQRAAKKNELEMVIRTGRPSDKMMLQELMNAILKEKNLTLNELISKGEKAGISFLFNQQSTGRISGISYFYKEFKIKGQALGNRFKWSELIKKINYEQVRDSKAVSEANDRTRAIYGETVGKSAEQHEAGNGSNRLPAFHTEDTGYNRFESAAATADGAADQSGRGKVSGANQDADNISDTDHNRFNGITIQISDDEDDAKYRRRSRRLGR